MLYLNGRYCQGSLFYIYPIQFQADLFCCCFFILFFILFFGNNLTTTDTCCMLNTIPSLGWGDVYTYLMLLSHLSTLINGLTTTAGANVIISCNDSLHHKSTLMVLRQQ